MKVKNIYLHFKKICIHKKWVFYYAWKMGIPWRGFMHDWSKFSPVEFWESVKYYAGTYSPIDKCKEENGYSKAWLHHKGHNKHHYHYWTDYFDEGMRPVCMPFTYSVEMLADFLGAARAYMGDKFSFAAEAEWWDKKIQSPAIHPVQKDFITSAFAYMIEYNKIPNKIILWILYDLARRSYDNECICSN